MKIEELQFHPGETDAEGEKTLRIFIGDVPADQRELAFKRVVMALNSKEVRDQVLRIANGEG